MSTKIKTPISQEAFALEPDFQGALRLLDEVSWTFSIIMGRSGSKQVPLTCDDSGNLATYDSDGNLAAIADRLDSTIKTDSPWWYNGFPLAKHVYDNGDYLFEIARDIRSSIDDIPLADYFEETAANPPFYDSNDGTPLVDIMDEILTILTDVWDSVGNALRTNEIV